MKFNSATISRTGGRSENQDSYGYKSESDSGIWVVADGLGGHRGGEIASHVAVTAILDVWRPDAPLTTGTMATLVDAAQAAILEQQQTQPHLSSMRTTVVLLLAQGSEAVWAHVGDTRLYLFRESVITVQTLDHSVPQAMVAAGEITREQIRTHADRNRLLRAVGNPDEVKPTILGASQRIQHGDAFLLCTDGFWEYVTELEMAADLAAARTPQAWLERMEMRLVSKAKADNDNYTALALFIE